MCYLKEILSSSRGFEEDGEGESSVVEVGRVKWSGKIFNFLGVPSPIDLISDSTRARESALKRNKKEKKDYSFGAWTNNNLTFCLLFMNFSIIRSNLRSSIITNKQINLIKVEFLKTSVRIIIKHSIFQSHFTKQRGWWEKEKTLLQLSSVHKLQQNDFLEISKRRNLKEKHLSENLKNIRVDQMNCNYLFEGERLKHESVVFFLFSRGKKVFFDPILVLDWMKFGFKHYLQRHFYP